MGDFIHPATKYPKSHSGGACPGMLLSGSRDPENTGCRITSGMTKFLNSIASLKEKPGTSDSDFFLYFS